MDTISQMYYDKSTKANEIKGFTKTFKKFSKEKKQESQEILELLKLARERKLLLGAKVTEKAFKNGIAEKVFIANNCDLLTAKKIKHYANLVGVEIVELGIDKKELSEKLKKPFLISMLTIEKELKGGKN